MFKSFWNQRPLFFPFDSVAHFSPTLASRLAVSTASGLDRVVAAIVDVIEAPTVNSRHSGQEQAQTKLDSQAAEIVARLFTFLEDRRILFSSIWGVYGLSSLGSIKSIQEIRQRLTGELEKLPRDSSLLTESLRAMQTACHNFLDRYEVLAQEHPKIIGGPGTHPLVADFRNVFRYELSRLSEAFGVPLYKIVPRLQQVEHGTEEEGWALGRIFDEWE